jgi:hypothetical protein
MSAWSPSLRRKLCICDAFSPLPAAFNPSPSATHTTIAYGILASDLMFSLNVAGRNALDSISPFHLCSIANFHRAVLLVSYNVQESSQHPSHFIALFLRAGNPAPK